MTTSRKTKTYREPYKALYIRFTIMQRISFCRKEATTIWVSKELAASLQLSWHSDHTMSYMSCPDRFRSSQPRHPHHNSKSVVILVQLPSAFDPCSTTPPRRTATPVDPSTPHVDPAIEVFAKIQNRFVSPPSPFAKPSLQNPIHQRRLRIRLHPDPLESKKTRLTTAGWRACSRFVYACLSSL